MELSELTRRLPGFRLKNILDLVPDAAVVSDSRGIILSVNTAGASLFGYTPDELAGQSVEMLMPQRFRESHTGHRRAFHENPHRRAMGSRHVLYGRRKDGSEFPADITLNPLPSDGELLVLTAIRDITHLSELEELRTEAESLRNIRQMAAAIAHEVAQPLNVLSMVVALMQKKHGDDEDIMLAGQMIKRITRLLDSIRRITRLKKRPYLADEIVDIENSPKGEPLDEL